MPQSFWEILKHLVDNDAVNWIARFDGIYDIGFTIRVKKIFELSLFLDELKRIYYSYINELTFAVNIEVDFLPRNYLTSNTQKNRKLASYSTTQEISDINETDLKILKLLANNTRISATDIAESVNLTSETINQKILKLERSGIIQKYRIYLNNEIIGQSVYYAFIYLNSSSESRRKRFVKYCEQIPQLVYYIKALGEWDYELNFEVKNYTEYRSLMMDLTMEFSDIMKNYIGLPISKIYKFTLTP